MIMSFDDWVQEYFPRHTNSAELLDAYKALMVPAAPAPVMYQVEYGRFEEIPLTNGLFNAWQSWSGFMTFDKLQEFKRYSNYLITRVLACTDITQEFLKGP